MVTHSHTHRPRKLPYSIPNQLNTDAQTVLYNTQRPSAFKIIANFYRYIFALTHTLVDTYSASTTRLPGTSWRDRNCQVWDPKMTPKAGQASRPLFIPQSWCGRVSHAGPTPLLRRLGEGLSPNFCPFVPLTTWFLSLRELFLALSTLLTCLQHF